MTMQRKAVALLVGLTVWLSSTVALAQTRTPDAATPTWTATHPAASSTATAWGTPLAQTFTPYPALWTQTATVFPTPWAPTSWATPPIIETGDEPLDLDRILPPGEGRELIMWKCTPCHRYGVITRGQRSVARWEAIKWSHQGKMLVTPEQMDTMFAYLEANFNPDKPEPELPGWFLVEEDSPEW